MPCLGLKAIRIKSSDRGAIFFVGISRQTKKLLLCALCEGMGDNPIVSCQAKNKEKGDKSLVDLLSKLTTVNHRLAPFLLGGFSEAVPRLEVGSIPKLAAPQCWRQLTPVVIRKNLKAIVYLIDTCYVMGYDSCDDKNF